MITVDSKSLKTTRIGLAKLNKGIPQAFSRAINRVSQGVKTEAVRKVRQTYNLRARDVSALGNVKVHSTGQLEITLTSHGNNIPLIKFKTNPRAPLRGNSRRVLKAAVRKDSGMKPIPGAFVASMRSGNVGVYERIGKRRLPIQQLHGPAVPIMLNEPGVREHLEREAQRRLAIRLDHEVGRVLGALQS